VVEAPSRHGYEPRFHPKDVFDALDKARKFWQVTAFEFGPRRRPLLWLVVPIVVAVGVLTSRVSDTCRRICIPHCQTANLLKSDLRSGSSLARHRVPLQNPSDDHVVARGWRLLVLFGAGIGWHITRQGQITERFTRAVDQLGDDRLDVRLGGSHALARIAKNSMADRPAIFQNS
jgi:hypothetical protein